MNLKLRRSARTPHSEEISVFDSDMRDDNGEPLNIGKLDVHYVEDQIVGTLLIWAEYAAQFTQANNNQLTMTDLIDEILDEISEPLGVAAEYGIEVYYPRLDQHEFVANYDEEDELDELEEDDEEVLPADERDGRVH